jgi:23S rRNA pseudouridine2605 synthase
LIKKKTLKLSPKPLKPKSSPKARPAASAKPAPKPQENSMRLNHYISSAGISSRRRADELIKLGKVKVNSKLVTELGVQINPLKDRVLVDGKIVSLRSRNLYLVLNKPKDTITTVKDEIGRTTVLDYVKTHERIYPVGRLDRNTTGVLLLTNDGELTLRLTHPKYEIEREYHVTLDKPLLLKDAEKIAKGGVDIGRGNITSAIYLAVSKKDTKDVTVVIKEGKYREVRRLFEAFGYDVRKLDRTVFAGISHSGMKRGDVRTLTPSEVRRLKRLVGIEESYY